MPPADFSDPAILRHLRRSDPAVAALIRRHGPCTLVADPRPGPFASLTRAIVHQQLNGTAARTIEGRLRDLVGGRRLPKPPEIAGLSDDQLRGVGLSRAKVAALRDLAAKTLDGTVPSARSIARLDDEAIIERCIQVRGIGRWTVEMLLIFGLGRGDVWPVDDFGVRAGYRRAFSLDEMPKARDLRGVSEAWRPWRSVVAWYCWREADAAKD